MGTFFVYRRGDEQSVDHLDEDFLRRRLEIYELVAKYFRYEVHGLERVPRTGGGLVISPHSAITIDWVLLARELYHRYGRVLRGMTDHTLLRIPILRDVILRMGVVDGNRDNAHRLLRRGELCFAMPGGGDEAFKSSAHRYELRWEGHTGFVRVALKAQVPLIPTVCIGSDDAYYLPFDGMAWGKRILRTRLPIVAPIGLGALPLPVKFTAYVGEPIHFDHEPAAADDEATVAECHARAVREMEDLITEGLQRRKSLWR